MSRKKKSKTVFDGLLRKRCKSIDSHRLTARQRKALRDKKYRDRHRKEINTKKRFHYEIKKYMQITIQHLQQENGNSEKKNTKYKQNINDLQATIDYYDLQTYNRSDSIDDKKMFEN